MNLPNTRPAPKHRLHAFTAETEPGSVTIYYDGNEVLYWNTDEFGEDPSSAISAITAVIQAYNDPDALYGWLVDSGRITG